MKTQTKLAMAMATAVSAMMAVPVQALDWEAYFRAGPGASKKNNSRACYGLTAVPGLKYRLGNECDFYGEFGLNQTFKAENVDYKAYVMFNIYEGNSNGDSEKVGVNQMYVEGKGYDVLPEATFWVGKRFYGRYDVHIVDEHYANMSGTGGGFYGLPAGPGKLGVSYFKNDYDDSNRVDDEGNPVYDPGTVNSNRFNVEYYDLPVNPGGKLRLVGTFTKGNYSGGKSGLGLNVLHFQENLFGIDGKNTVWLQYAQGSANLNGGFSRSSDDDDVKSFRIVDGFTWQAGPFGGQAQVQFRHDKLDGGDKRKSFSIGGRGSYAITNNFKLVAEAGYSQMKQDGSDTGKLSKFTFAPTLSTGPGFWKRPELRLYVTTAKWNRAARQYAGGSLETGTLGSDTSGTSYGLQAEIWF